MDNEHPSDADLAAFIVGTLKPSAWKATEDHIAEMRRLC